MPKNISTRIQNKHDLEANWLKASGFIPLVGELIIYDAETQATFNAAYATLTDAQKAALGRTAPIPYVRTKIGDGVTKVSDLDFTGVLAGATDPGAQTKSQFYFKYSTN